MTPGLDRLSINQITIEQWSLSEIVEGCAQAGIGWIAPWRHKVAELGTMQAARRIRESGLRVSSLCRGGFFTDPESTDADNRRALEEAAELGAPVLVLVCGPPGTCDLVDARSRIAEGIERLVPHALDLGVRLAIEPLHPMMIADRSAIVTLGEALALSRRFDPSAVGVVVDAYHVFWDPDLASHLAGANGLIASFHISDWVTPRDDVLASRALPGDGIIDLPGLRNMVEAAGYRGPVEVEVINHSLRALPGEAVLARVIERYGTHVFPNTKAKSIEVERC